MKKIQKGGLGGFAQMLAALKNPKVAAAAQEEQPPFVAQEASVDKPTAAVAEEANLLAKKGAIARRNLLGA